MGTDVKEELDRLLAIIKKLEERVDTLEHLHRQHEKEHSQDEYRRQMEGF